VRTDAHLSNRPLDDSRRSYPAANPVRHEPAASGCCSRSAGLLSAALLLSAAALLLSLLLWAFISFLLRRPAPLLSALVSRKVVPWRGASVILLLFPVLLLMLISAHG